MFNAYLPQRFSLFSGPYHLIYNFPLPSQARPYYQEYGQPRVRPEIELYDTQSDPGERREISLENKKAVDALRPEIVRILKEIRGLRKTRPRAGLPLEEEQDALRTLGYL